MDSPLTDSNALRTPQGREKEVLTLTLSAEVLKSDVSGLAFPADINKALQRAPLLQVIDGVPRKLEIGILRVDQLIQLSSEDICSLPMMGPKSAGIIERELRKIDLELGVAASKINVSGNAIPSVRLASGEEYWGYIPEIADGSMAQSLGAARILNLALREIPEIDEVSLARLECNLVRDQHRAGEVRPVSTIGELIQCPYNRPHGTDPLFNLLLERGLCFRMKVTQEVRESLSLAPIAFESYKLEPVC